MNRERGQGRENRDTREERKERREYRPRRVKDVKGMKMFLDGFKAHGGDARPDFYVLASYIQGLVMVEALKSAIANKDLTRAGFLKSLQGIDGFDAGGLAQPLSLTKVPYVTGTRTRILKPDMTNKTWTVEAPYASPKS